MAVVDANDDDIHLIIDNKLTGWFVRPSDGVFMPPSASRRVFFCPSPYFLYQHKVHLSVYLRPSVPVF